MSGIFAFDNSYARLPERFFTRTHPTPVINPRLIRVTRELCEEMGLDADALATPEGVEILSGNRIAEGSEPIATAYAGHQFGGWVPQLGDGRAILLGEVIDRAGNRRDIQLKGSGRTPFSRGGDGRAALGPVLREYIVSEAMWAMGIPTTRSLAAVTTGEEVERETTLPGAILTRVAASHIRVGTFQFFASRGDIDAVRLLADHVIARHYPNISDADNPYRALLDAVIAAQARLIAQWLHIGFIHGVMNTDNMSIAGETIDYGPCAFMDEYNPAMVYSSIDRWGRYAYNNQPTIAQWNLARLAECLLPLLSEDAEAALETANEALNGFAPVFEAEYHNGLRRKLGLLRTQEEDLELARELLQIMTDNGADFTNTFRRLSDDIIDEPFENWAQKWRDRLAKETTSPEERRRMMKSVNPAFIPRNHRVEEAIVAATNGGDFKPFERLVNVLCKPFDDQPEFAEYMRPPAEHEKVLQTFCGT